MASWLKLGTRGSPLALAQARAVALAIASAHGLPDGAIEIVVVRTTGDAIQDRALSEAGGKGLFTKELDTALVERRIDLAVHSAKDLPTHFPATVAIAGCLAREDPRDVLVARHAGSIAALPHGARVGSASLRREAQLRRLRPDVSVELLRGNVGTRLGKVASGEFDATLLALAGLKRLGLAHRASAILDTDAFLPAVGQGAIAITIRAEDAAARTRLAPALDRDCGLALVCERAFLAVLDGSCRTPIAGHAEIDGDRLRFRGLILRRDGSDARETMLQATVDQAQACGEAAGADLLGRMPAGFLDA